MDRSLEALVWRRARSHCEYCQFPAEYSEAPFQIDHIIARKHDGGTTEDNLALACYYCNSYKGPNIAGIDLVTGRMVRLFHPRQDLWSVHFAWDGPELAGLTAIARATIHVLCMNHPLVIGARRWLSAASLFPPDEV